MAEREPGTGAQTLQERMVRADERERVLGEMEQDAAQQEEQFRERDRAVLALLIFATGTALVLLPLWAAIIGAAIWVGRTVGGAPTPW